MLFRDPLPLLPLLVNQYRISGNSQEITGLSELHMDRYTPQNAYYKFMYLKKKFVNLESLTVNNQDGIDWLPISDFELDAIVGYLLSLRYFEGEDWLSCDIGLCESNVQLIQQTSDLML